MASLLTIKLNKAPGTSWGIRLQGGKDFASPLCIQKVNNSSVAEKCGLQAGDAIVSINSQDVFSLRHKEAQDLIVKAGNNFDMVVQRGMHMWRPAVTPLQEVQSNQEGIPVATKTSLAATPQKPLRCIGSNYNCVPRPFPGSSSSKTTNLPVFTASTNGRPTSPDSRGEVRSHACSAFSNGYLNPSSISINDSSGSNIVSSSNSICRSFGVWPQKFDIDEATSALTISGTDIALNKENARNFLLMTLNNDIRFNEDKHANNIKGSNFRSTNSLPRYNSSIPFVGSSAKYRGPRKYSYGSNCSSLSSASSQDGEIEESCHRQFLDHYQPIGSGHNSTAAPFGEAGSKQIVNAQFNSPINIYSEDAIAETLSAQAEVLGKGVLGINFKKYEKETKIRTDSPTYRLLHGEEDESSPRKPRPKPVQSESGSHLPFQHDPTEQQQAQLPGSKAPIPTQSFSHAGQVPHAGAPGTEGLHPGDNICAGCERLITGVFVRVKNKNLHADCFKCATCGSSLKNVGYYNINEKLYCDIHAKQAVRHHPPAPNMVPVTVQPGSTPPAGAMTSPQARATKAPFQSKIPYAGVPSPAPVSAPEPPVQPEPILQEPIAPAPVPEPTFPEPILEPLPMSVEEVEESPAPPVDESEPPQEVEVLQAHEKDISVETPQSQEVRKDSTSGEIEVDSEPLEQLDVHEIVENHVQAGQELNEQTSLDFENLPQDDCPPQLPDDSVIGDLHELLADTVIDSYLLPEDETVIDESININGIPDETKSEIFSENHVEKSSAFETAPELPFEVKSVGKGVSFEAQEILNSSYSKHVSKEEHYVETKSSVILASDPSEILRIPVVPAPSSVPAPSPIHKVAPPVHVPVVAPSFHQSSANPQSFGAPAGDLNVRAHIPKKGQRFEWPPQRAVREDDDEAHPPAWAPSGDIPSVPKPIKPAGPPPKTPPLLPTPPPPKDYDVIVMKTSTPANIQAGQNSHPLTISKSQPLPSLKSKPTIATQVPTKGPPPPVASRFPKLAPSYIIIGGTTEVATPVYNDVDQAAPVPSSKSYTSVILKKASTNRSLISPPKLVPVTVSMPFDKLDFSPLQLSEPYIKPNFPKQAPIPVISVSKTNTEPIIGFKPVPTPAPSPMKVAPSGINSLKQPIATPHPPAPVPVKSSLPASVPASAENVTPKPVPSNPSNLADAAPTESSSFGSDFMPKPTPPPGGIAFPKLGGSARGFQAPGQRSAPRRGRGVMNPASASRIPVCASCQRQIRGPFVSALGKTWCPDHFICATETCRKPIIEMGFVEEQGKLYCEVCYESYLAPICGKCDKRVKGDCLNAVGKQFHPECFCCAYCGKVFGSGAFYLEDGLPYCETDWNDLFTTKCVGCNFPIEAGDRWVEALNNNYHSQCFKCSKCHKNLEGQSFFAKGGKPFCKAHAQRGF